MSAELFKPIFVPDRFRAVVSGKAWLQAMLDTEGALAVAEARAGLIPREAAEALVSRCEAGRFDPEKIGHKGLSYGNPVPPLVKALTEAVLEVSEDASRYVHKGATSQDITDTAAMLVALRAGADPRRAGRYRRCLRPARREPPGHSDGGPYASPASPTDDLRPQGGGLAGLGAGGEAKATRRARVGAGRPAGRGRRDAGLAGKGRHAGP